MSAAELVSKVPGSVARDQGIPLERAGSAEQIAERIREGKALLKVVSTPWGVDFYIVEVGAIP